MPQPPPRLYAARARRIPLGQRAREGGALVAKRAKAASQETCQAAAGHVPATLATNRRWGGEGRTIPMTTQIQTASLGQSKALTLIAALLIGGLFVFAAGFMPAQAMHDAAHDTRHSVGFPCH